MKWKFISQQNNVVSCVFDDNIEILPEMYSCMNHNLMLFIPGKRDLSNGTMINYDTLGTMLLLDEIKNKKFNRSALYEFVYKILETLDKITSAGVDIRQVVTSIDNIYLSLYDKSARFICLPIEVDLIEEPTNFTELIKNIALNINSDGAYDIIGFLIEKAKTNVDISELKQTFSMLFEASLDSSIQNSIQKPATTDQNNQFASVRIENGSKKNITDNVEPAKEYIPLGAPAMFTSSPSNTVDAKSGNNGTIDIISTSTDSITVYYLLPAESDSEDERIYLHTDLFTIGRNTNNDLQLKALVVGRTHAELRRIGTHYSVVDLSSANHTYVNNKPIPPETPIQLKSNDVLSFSSQVSYTYFEEKTNK